MGAAPVASVGDERDGEANGVTVIDADPAGYYLLQDLPPDGYAPAPPVVIALRPGGNELTIRNLPPD